MVECADGLAVATRLSGIHEVEAAGERRCRQSVAASPGSREMMQCSVATGREWTGRWSAADRCRAEWSAWLGEEEVWRVERARNGSRAVDIGAIRQLRAGGFPRYENLWSRDEAHGVQGRNEARQSATCKLQPKSATGEEAEGRAGWFGKRYAM